MDKYRAMELKYNLALACAVAVIAVLLGGLVGLIMVALGS